MNNVVVKKEIIKKWLSLVLLILWAILIFVMSSFPADVSNNQSGMFVSMLSNIFFFLDKAVLNLVIRKLAHFTEYFILGLLVANFLQNFAKSVNFTVFICLLQAIIDETHQLFVPGRSGNLLDVLLDCSGSISAFLAYYFISKYVKDHN